MLTIVNVRSKDRAERNAIDHEGKARRPHRLHFQEDGDRAGRKEQLHRLPRDAFSRGMESNFILEVSILKQPINYKYQNLVIKSLRFHITSSTLNDVV
jgi:hypothetical protein